MRKQSISFAQVIKSFCINFRGVEPQSPLAYALGMVFPQYTCSSLETTHSATSNEKGRYAMRKRTRKRLSYNKLRNTKKFSIFPTMLDTHTIIVSACFFARKFMHQLVKVLFP